MVIITFLHAESFHFYKGKFKLFKNVILSIWDTSMFGLIEKSDPKSNCFNGRTDEVIFRGLFAPKTHFSYIIINYCYHLRNNNFYLQELQPANSGKLVLAAYIINALNW